MLSLNIPCSSVNIFSPLRLKYEIFEAEPDMVIKDVDVEIPEVGESMLIRGPR